MPLTTTENATFERQPLADARGYAPLARALATTNRVAIAHPRAAGVPLNFETLGVMITPELKGLFSADIERPSLPPDPEGCLVSMQATIGPKDGNGEELFFFTVATPKGLAREALPRWGRGLLVVEEFSWVVVERALIRLLAHAQCQSWSEVASALNKELNWEFENYQPS